MSDIGEMLEKVDVDWVLDREGIAYRQSYGRSGLQLNARTCPFCGGDDYKVYINAETGVGNCFHGSCPQKSFSKWTLFTGLFQLRGREMVSMLEQLAMEQGWRPKRKNTCDADILRAMLALPDSVAIEDCQELPEYLARRGVTAEVASYFGLRLCTKGEFTFPKPDGSMGRQDYSNRIIIPLLDLDGELVSFQGRDITGEAERRYLFPPGFAAAGAYLYNALNWQGDMEGLIICEGAFDVIGAKLAIDETQDWRDWLPIGTFGMHLSSGDPTGNDQIGRLTQLKGRGLKKVIFLWDGELKAAKGAIEASLLLLGRGIASALAMLPPGKDPGAASAQEIRHALATAQPIRTRADALTALLTARKRYPAGS